jgi:hypothetical protein
MTDIESLEREIVELERKRDGTSAAALRDAVAAFCNCAALFENTLANAVNSPDREWVVKETLLAISSLQAALRPRQSHGRSYRFADPEETVVIRDDGASFSWPRDSSHSHTNPRLHGRMIASNIPHSRVVEQWHHDGNPMPESYRGDKHEA